MPVIDSHHRLHVAKPSGALLYIRDGLEAMWDGIENAGWGIHDNTLTTWKDLVGGYDGTLANSGISWSNDSLSITGNCHPCVVPNGIGTILHTKNFTIEIVNKSSNRNRRGTIFGNYNADNGQGFNIEWRYGNGTNYTYRAYFNASPDVSTTELYALNTKQTTTITLSGNDLRMYRNGEIFYSRSNQTITAPGITQYCLGGEMARTNMVALGNLYAVRIYSRALSQDEIEANFRLDTERTSVTSPYTKSFSPIIYRPGFTYRLVCENSYTGKHFYCTSVLDGERVYSTWEITSGSQYATINNNGKVNIVSGTSNQTITVKCSYPYQGETLERTKDITISYDNELKIECADTLVGTSGNAIARYNDEIVTPTWSIVGTGATIDANGAITITASGTVEIHATYSNQAASKTVNLEYVANKSSTTTVDENGAVTTTTTETIVNQDGSTTDTSTSMTVHEDGSISNTTSETTTQEDGSSTTTSTTTNQDGTSSQTEIQGNADGSSTSTTNEYNADGDMTKTINGEIDTSGNESTQNIEYDDEGTATVTGYAIDTSGNEDGTKTFNTEGVNTEFYGFDAVDGFEMDLHFKFDFTNQPSGQNENHHQILCMKRANPSPWYGFQIRQTGTNKTVILGTQFATGSNTNTNLPISWVETNKIAEFNIHIKYDPTLASDTFVATDLIGGTTIYRSSNKFPDLPELRYLTVCLGYALGENGNPYRYSNVDILNFNLVKIANA